MESNFNHRPLVDPKEILKRAASYKDMPPQQLQSYLSYALGMYTDLYDKVTELIGSNAHYGTRKALTKGELILMLLAVTQPEYDKLKAFPHEELPLYLDYNWMYPDFEALFKERLQNG